MPKHHVWLGPLALLTAAVVSWPAEKIYPLRWVYISRSLRSDKDVEDIREIAKTAAGNGLNGILLAARLDTIDLQPPEYFPRLEKVKEIAKQYKLEIVPNIFSAGYGGSILAHDRNLAEGLPVKDALFVVKNGEARLEPEVPVADGGPAAEGMWTRDITVKPYRCYRVTFRAKTEGIGGGRPFSSGPFRLTVQTDDKRNLTPWRAPVPDTTDWREVRWGFNSLWYDKVKISIGLPSGREGKAWVDSVRVEEIGLLNVLRRPGTPVTVRSDSDSTVYEEGRDYDRIVDPQLTFRFDHDPPFIRILEKSRIRDGARLRVSYYHGFSINDGQTTICMGEPKVYEIWRDMARRMHAAVAPPRYVLSMDEIREGGTCEACRGRNMGKLLGEGLTKQFQMLREVNPKVDVWVWSDMLDPNHNAHGNYYLVNGDYTGSWEHVPKDMGIMCWYYERRALSLPFFSKLGFRTMAGAYYDGDTLDNPRGWLEELDKTPGAQGIVYTTWLNKYKLLADFGKLVSRE
jgi:hypothetical protein